MRQNESPDNIIPVSGGTQTAGQVVQYAEEPQQEVAGDTPEDAAVYNDPVVTGTAPSGGGDFANRY